MKIVIAVDSFKGSLTAPEACALIEHALHDALPEARIVCLPMADGGQGTARALLAAANGRWIPRRVCGPLPGTDVDAGFVALPDGTAVVEMACASGLCLLDPARRNPMNTTTYGTGQLLAAARDHGARRILLAVGGSATVDLGAGAAAALGWQFLDSTGSPLPGRGGDLPHITSLRPPGDPALPEIHVLCDVDNPLLGPQGAAAVFAPQKGASPAMVEYLEAGLNHLAGLIRHVLGADIANLAGGGAAGGLAAGAVAFFNARLTSGIDEVMHTCGLPRELADADWVITGEGSFDAQSLRGKVVSGVARTAVHSGARVAVLAGQIHLSPEQYHAAGIRHALACQPPDASTDSAIAHAPALLTAAARRLAPLLSRSARD